MELCLVNKHKLIGENNLKYGIIVAKKKYNVYFITCHNLISQLSLPYKKNKLEVRLKHYSKYKILICVDYQSLMFYV
ncbi:hypothetical protein [Clostridium botulinum]|uniref:hypothetical protein n=1 Tax=Clostridium botulinum TaxID=1491 RepID=UPI0013F03106|nr:hypothetical protein [Clostridium botulinum]MBY7053092.1 hypothetical protein [Clostridium botulinum]NFH86186.1 hypothetical protein [Clostridium botulinum]NFM64861.1 hypothetical protein [Clostridium botulinum]